MANNISNLSAQRTIINLDSILRLGDDLDLYCLSKKKVKQILSKNNLINVVVPGTFYYSEVSDRFLAKLSFSLLLGLSFQVEQKRWNMVSYHDILSVINSSMTDPTEVLGEDILFRHGQMRYLGDYASKVEEFISQRVLVPRTDITYTPCVPCNAAEKYQEAKGIYKHVDFESELNRFFYDFVNKHQIDCSWK
jgi:hypothetical protein